MKDIKSKRVTKRILSKNKNKQVLYVLRSKIRPKKIKKIKSIIKLNPKRISKKIKTKRVRFRLPIELKNDHNN